MHVRVGAHDMAKHWVSRLAKEEKKVFQLQWNLNLVKSLGPVIYCVKLRTRYNLEKEYY